MERNIKNKTIALADALKKNIQRRKNASTIKDNKLYIGLMSGTSLDGLDASIISTDGVEHLEFIADLHLPYPKQFQSEIRLLIEDPSKDFILLEQEFTNYNILAVNDLLQKANISSQDIAAIGFHGQTIYHAPEKKISLQIGNPQQLKESSNIDVVYDFRNRDIKHGGQGAPLIPIFHQAFLKSKYPSLSSKTNIIVNIGGVSNVTYIDKEKLTAFDSGPGNALINDAMLKFYNQEFDNFGEIASKGVAALQVVDDFIKSHQYFTKLYPKSLDRNQFNDIWLLLNNLSHEDIVASLTYFSSKTITLAIEQLIYLQKPSSLVNIFICGGGAKNITIINFIRTILDNRHANIFDIKYFSQQDADYMESRGFAYLAARYINNVPSSFPETTGVGAPTICGAILKN